MQRITFDLLMIPEDGGEPFHLYVSGEGLDPMDCAQDAIDRAEREHDAKCSDWSPMTAWAA